MKLKKIKLRNFRNYDSLEIDLDDNLNIVIGDNAQGKTNLLESIYVLAVTRLFLSNYDKTLIKFDNKFSSIFGSLEKNNQIFDLNIIFSDKGKVVKINNKEIKKISDYISVMNVVVFSSDSIRIFKENPSFRRKYFNVQISQINKKYLKLLNDFNVILKQRNEFLKIINLDKQTDINYLEILDEKYINISYEIYKIRTEFVSKLNEYLDDIFFSITGISNLKLVYNSNLYTSVDEDKEEVLKRLKNNLEKDIMYKMTMLGPNRDDFSFILDDKNLLLYGSQGQIRSAILSLKLSEVNLFKKETKEMPILLLDDIFSELDITKRNNILKYLNNDIQTIITTTDINDINEDIKNKATIWKVEDGKLFPGK